MLATLLVEPETQVRHALELELSIRGHEIVSHADAASALTAFHDNLFQMFIVSTALPNSDAFQLCRDVRALPGGNETTIVVVSQTSSEDDRNEAFAAGADEVIVFASDGRSLGDPFDRAERAAARMLVADPQAIQGSSERFLVISPSGSIRAASPVAERLLGFPPAAIAGVNAFSFFHSDDAPQLLSIITEACTQPGTTRAVEVRVRRAGDSWQTIVIAATNKMADPLIVGIVFDLRGPDARIGVDDQVTRAAMHDHVTDLPNRSLFIDRVDHAVVRSARRQQSVIVMVIDFDNFASDDSRDSAAIDDGLLIAVAQRLRSCLRSSDSAARLSHDDFGVLLEEVNDVDNISIVADRIVRAMSVPFFSGGTELTLTAHIGIAISSPSRLRAVDLLRDASIARAWARVQGSGSHVTFDPSMQPPDDEPTTSQFEAVTEPAPVPGLDHRLDELHERIATLESTLARIVPVNDQDALFERR